MVALGTIREVRPEGKSQGRIGPFALRLVYILQVMSS